MKLLIVDDDPAILLIASRFLQQAGFVVLQAGDGAAALELARREKPDALILDCVMPDLDGPALLQRMRAEIAETSAVPVIFLTADVSPENVEKLRALGAKGVIAKPFKPAGLAAEIKRNLES